LLAASNYPFLDVVWTMVIFFCWIIWFMLLFRVIADIFRRHDIHGGGKTLWLIFVIILPFLGVFIYLIAEGHGMADRDMKNMQQSQQQFDQYVQSVASSGGTAAEIEKAKSLLDSGAITQAEFDTLKAKALAT
jgi:ABC-type multidrug transport system fused ATPase/permease subunit